MRLSSLSMRWWLALVFAAIVALTAIAVAEVLSLRSDRALHARTQELAAGAAVTAAAAFPGAADLDETADREARERRIAIFLFDERSSLVASANPNGITLASVSDLPAAVGAALAGRRLIQSTAEGRRVVVALPLNAPPAAAMVAVAARPDLAAAREIVRGQLLGTVLIATAVGLGAGILVAGAITSRLRRIARAAKEIEGGRFDEPLRPRFHDELGQLAGVVDSMRVRLRDSFRSVEAERDRLARLLEQLQEGVIAVDPGLHIVFANPRARLLLGRRALAEGSRLPEPWPGFSLRAFASELFTPGGGPRNVRVSGDEEHTYAIAGIPARPGAVTALIVVADVTIADRRERAEREFVANAAHELRTPLTAIASAVEVLQGGAKDEPAERDALLHVIQRQSARLGRLVRALLALARAQTREEPVRLEAVEIAPLLEEVAADVRGANGRQVEARCPPGLVALGHRDLLAQAIGNLAANAARHGGGTVLLSGARAGERVLIDVRDDGAGIAARDRDRVFDRFYRGGERDSEGFGLGLPIAREVVGALGGELELEAVETGGTSARIFLASAEGR